MHESSSLSGVELISKFPVQYPVVVSSELRLKVNAVERRGATTFEDPERVH